MCNTFSTNHCIPLSLFYFSVQQIQMRNLFKFDWNSSWQIEKDNHFYCRFYFLRIVELSSLISKLCCWQNTQSCSWGELLKSFPKYRVSTSPALTLLLYPFYECWVDKARTKWKVKSSENSIVGLLFFASMAKIINLLTTIIIITISKTSIGIYFFGSSRHSRMLASQEQHILDVKMESSVCHCESI